MSKMLRFVLLGFFSLAILLVGEFFYLSSFFSLDKQSLEQKRSFVSYVGLPDLAMAATPYLRHRSLSGVFDVYSIDGALREYEKESYLLSPLKESR